MKAEIEGLIEDLEMWEKGRRRRGEFWAAMETDEEEIQVAAPLMFEAAAALRRLTGEAVEVTIDEDERADLDDPLISCGVIYAYEPADEPLPTETRRALLLLLPAPNTPGRPTDTEEG